MSLTSSYQGETASASPESPREGDFSSRQFYDNFRSLEEHETCDKKRGPIVNSVPDNYSGFPLKAQICASLVTNDLENVCSGISSTEEIEKRHWRKPEGSTTSLVKEKLSASTHFMECRALDGRFITLVSTQTQTDWEREEQSLSFSFQVQKEVLDLQMLYDEMNTDTVTVYSKGTKDEETEVYDIPCLGLPRLIAYRREPKQTIRISKLPEVVSEKHAHLAPCEYCQKLCQPFRLDEALKNETQFERVFCCEKAKQMREIIQKEREKLELKYFGRMMDVHIHTSVSRQEWETEEPQKEWMSPFQRWREQMKYQNSDWYSVSKEMRHESLVPKTNCEISLGMLTPQEGTILEPKIEDVIQKFYKNGACFLIMFSDGTGTVFYPSGKPAMIISSAEPSHFSYIILEDKDKAPCIKGIFTTKGYSTCYHPNGRIWLNITPGGGLCFSETGDLRRRWNWLYFDPHVRNLPFKPLIFTLGPYISVRVHSQDCVYINFVQKENHIRFNVGSELKLICPDSHYQSGQGVLERYIQMKKTEIHSLLDQIQTRMSHPFTSVCNIKPHHRFIARKERLSKQVEEAKSPKEENAHPI